jgi:hypothetical protein
LLARAQIIVDRGPVPQGAEERVDRVETAAEMLRQNHDRVTSDLAIPSMDWMSHHGRT